MKLNDLELNRYSFFARTTQLDDEDELWGQFKPRLESAVKSVGGWENTSQKNLTRPAARQGYFVPIATSKQGDSEFVFHDGFHRKLISGIFLDAYVLQERIGLEERISSFDRLSAAAEQLKAQLPRHAETVSQFPTECFCHFTELEESFGEPHKIFKTLLGTDDFTQTEFRHAFFAITLQDDVAKAAIIAKTFEGRGGKDQASKMVDLLLQEYFLSFAKVVHEIDAIDQLNAVSSRKNLNDYLRSLNERQPATLSEIEKANQTLSRHRAELAEKLQTIEAHQQTIAVNITNAERILDNLLWREKKGELHPILIGPLKYRVEQIKVNLTYLRISEDMARIKGEEIANESNLKAAGYGRKLAWIFGSLSLIGALQLFPAFINWSDNFVKALVLGCVIFIPIWIAFAEDIRTYFFKGGHEEFEPPEDSRANVLSQRAPQGLPPKSNGIETASTLPTQQTEPQEANLRRARK